MARSPVQEYPSVEPTLAPANDYQNINATPSSFGGAIGSAEERGGQSLEQASAALTSAAVLIQNRHNEVAGDEAINQFIDGADKLTNGDPGNPDPTKRTGLMQLRGKDALDAAPIVQNKLMELRQQIFGGLQNSPQQLYFDQASRRFMEFRQGSISAHLDAQSNAWAEATAKAQQQTAATVASNNFLDDDAIAHGLSEAENGAAKAVQTRYGDAVGDDIKGPAMVEARSHVIRSVVERALSSDSNGQTHPDRAAAILQKFGGLLDPKTAEELTRAVRATHDAVSLNSDIQDWVSGAPPSAGRPSAPPPTGGSTPSRVFNALVGTEGSGPNAVSPKGASGKAQIMEGTFNDNKLPGESYSNEDDRVAAARRYVDAMWKKYPGDADRVAVGYFSGTGNVAPPGSATAWVADKDDGTAERPGTKVSEYVARFRQKLGMTAPAPAAAAPAPSAAAQPAGQGAQPAPYVIGDSLAVGIRAAGGYDGNAQEKIAPDVVLRNIQATPVDKVRGQPVILSSGISNAPTQAQLGVVEQQIDALKEKSPASITLVGVGDRPDLAPLNASLQQIAARTGATFQPIDPATLSPDRVHPANYRSLGIQPVAAQTTEAPAPTQAPFAVAPGVVQHNPAGIDMLAQRYIEAPAEGARRYPNDPVMQDRFIRGTRQNINELISLQNRDEAVRTKALHDQQEAAANSVITSLLENPATFDPSVIAKNPYLRADQKENLAKFAQAELARSGVPDLKSYGPGYSKAYSDIFAAEDDPRRISTVYDILKRAGPGGDLTLQGADVLSRVFTASRKNPDESAVHATEASMLQYAKSHLSFEQDLGPIKIRDPEGEAIFSGQFVPKFEKMLSDWRKEGKDPWLFLTRENVDKLLSGMRDPTKMARDRLAASGQDAPGDVEKPGTPIPPAPPGLNPGEWSGMMSAPPNAENGNPLTHAAWAETLKRMAADPEKVVPWFDFHFSTAGYSGAELVQRLKSPYAPRTLPWPETPMMGVQ